VRTREHGTCVFTIDVRQLGDPANSCPKDFAVKWRCGTATEVLWKYLPGEARKEHFTPVPGKLIVWPYFARIGSTLGAPLPVAKKCEKSA